MASEAPKGAVGEQFGLRLPHVLVVRRREDLLVAFVLEHDGKKVEHFLHLFLGLIFYLLIGVDGLLLVLQELQDPGNYDLELSFEIGPDVILKIRERKKGLEEVEWLDDVMAHVDHTTAADGGRRGLRKVVGLEDDAHAHV